MDTLNNKDAIVGEAHFLTIILPLTRYEIILGHFNCLAFHQTGKVLAQQLVIHCLDIIEVILAIRKLGSIKTVHKIVISRKRIRSQATSQ